MEKLDSISGLTENQAENLLKVYGFNEMPSSEHRNILIWELMKKSISKTGRLVIVEESPRLSGIGAEITATCAEEMLDYLIAPIRRVAAPDTPAPFSPVMGKFYVPDTEKIVSVVKEVINISS